MRALGQLIGAHSDHARGPNVDKDKGRSRPWISGRGIVQHHALARASSYRDLTSATTLSGGASRRIIRWKASPTI